MPKTPKLKTLKIKKVTVPKSGRWTKGGGTHGIVTPKQVAAAKKIKRRRKSPIDEKLDKILAKSGKYKYPKSPIGRITPKMEAALKKKYGSKRHSLSKLLKKKK